MDSLILYGIYLWYIYLYDIDPIHSMIPKSMLDINIHKKKKNFVCSPKKCLVSAIARACFANSLETLEKIGWQSRKPSETITILDVIHEIIYILNIYKLYLMHYNPLQSHLSLDSESRDKMNRSGWHDQRLEPSIASCHMGGFHSVMGKAQELDGL